MILTESDTFLKAFLVKIMRNFFSKSEEFLKMNKRIDPNECVWVGIFFQNKNKSTGTIIWNCRVRFI